MDDAAEVLERLLPAAGPPLPPGRVMRAGDVQRVAYWLSDAAAPAGLWGQLRAAGSGLWPLLLEGLHLGPDRPWVNGELGLTATSAPADHDPNEALGTLWRPLTVEGAGAGSVPPPTAIAEA